MRWTVGLAAVVAAAGLVTGTVAAGAGSAVAAGTAPRVVTVRSDRVWTTTALQIHAGDTLAIHGSGRMRFGAPPIDRLTPLGVPRGPRCEAIGGARSEGWPAPDLNCWSLIARIGASTPFAVGDARTVRAPANGQLQLGINDNHLEDNAGSWSATITVAAAAVPSAPPASESRPAAKKSSIVLPAALAALVVLALAGVILVLRRRRGMGTAAAPPVDAALAPVAMAPPPLVDSTVGNFLDIEFDADGRLTVSYNHFPDDTAVTWSAAYAGAAPRTGEFVTEGGGEERHTIVIPSAELDALGRAADINFTWAVAGVPFRYAVRRSVPAAAEPLP